MADFQKFREPDHLPAGNHSPIGEQLHDGSERAYHGIARNDLISGIQLNPGGLVCLFGAKGDSARAFKLLIELDVGPIQQVANHINMQGPTSAELERALRACSVEPSRISSILSQYRRVSPHRSDRSQEGDEHGRRQALALAIDERTLSLEPEKVERFKQVLSSVSQDERAKILARVQLVYEVGGLALVSVDQEIPESVATVEAIRDCFVEKAGLWEPFRALLNPTTYNYISHIGSGGLHHERVESFEAIPYRAWAGTLEGLFA